MFPFDGWLRKPTPRRMSPSMLPKSWTHLLLRRPLKRLALHAFLPYKKAGGTIVAYSSGFTFLPPAHPFLSKSSAYSVSKMATARFHEFLALGNPDLNRVCPITWNYSNRPLRQGWIETGQYSRHEEAELAPRSVVQPANRFSVQLPAHLSVRSASPEAKPLSGRFLFANWMWNN